MGICYYGAMEFGFGTRIRYLTFRSTGNHNSNACISLILLGHLVGSLTIRLSTHLFTNFLNLLFRRKVAADDLSTSFFTLPHTTTILRRDIPLFQLELLAFHKVKDTVIGIGVSRMANGTAQEARMRNHSDDIFPALVQVAEARVTAGDSGTAGEGVGSSFGRPDGVDG